MTLTKKNIVNSSNNKLTYTLPIEATFVKGDKIAVSQLALNFSWFNISAKYRNNFFQYKWFNSSSELETFDVHIEDGYYTVDTLYEVFQFEMIKNKHYLVDPGGNPVYFFEIKSSATFYALYFRLYSVGRMMTFDGLSYDITNPTSASDYRIAGDWLPPMGTDTYECGQIIIPSNNNFGAFVGFSSGQTISFDTTTDTIQEKYDKFSDTVPNLDPSSSYIMTCNMVKNELSAPDNILYTFSISGSDVSFGDTVTPVHEIVYSLINPGTYKEIDIAFYDENFEALSIIDPAMLLTLSIIRN